MSPKPHVIFLMMAVAGGGCASAPKQEGGDDLRASMTSASVAIQGGIAAQVAGGTANQFFLLAYLGKALKAVEAWIPTPEGIEANGRRQDSKKEEK